MKLSFHLIFLMVINSQHLADEKDMLISFCGNSPRQKGRITKGDGMNAIKIGYWFFFHEKREKF